MMKLHPLLLTAALASSPLALSGQQIREHELPVLSCASADSLFGPLRGKRPKIPATEIKGRSRVSLSVHQLQPPKGMPRFMLSLYADSVALPGQPTGEMAVIIEGDSANSFWHLDSIPPITLLLDDTLALSPRPAKRGTVRGGVVRQTYPLTVGLSPAVLRALVTARSSRIDVGGVNAAFMPATLEAARDAYRVALCGYGHL